MVSIFGLLQYIGIQPLGKIVEMGGEIGKGHITTMIANSGLVANYLAFCLPLFLIHKGLKYKVGFLITFICILLCKSNITFIALVVGAWFFVFLRLERKRLYVLYSCVISFVLLTIYLININTFNNFIMSKMNGRNVNWVLLFNHFKDNPLFGQGLGITKNFGIIYKTELLTFAHNDYFEIALQFGLIGLFLFLLVVINSFKRFNYKSIDRLSHCYFVSLVIFLVVMFGWFSMEIATSAFMGILSFMAVEKL